MISYNLKEAIWNAIPALKELVGKLTWNKISNNYKFITSEIKDQDINFYKLRKLIKSENAKKIPLKLDEALVNLQKIIDNIYDINLHVYKSTKSLTIIDIRYYLKSSIDEKFRETISDRPPTLHCKVEMPPWLKTKTEKFDINWHLNSGWNKWKMFLFKQRVKFSPRRYKSSHKNRTYK